MPGVVARKAEARWHLTWSAALLGVLLTTTGAFYGVGALALVLLACTCTVIALCSLEALS